MESIFIRDLRAVCIIGINPRERVDPQEIVLNIRMDADLQDACRSDDISDTIDYKVLKDQLLAFCNQSSYFLIERLADEIAQRILSYSPKVGRVEVCVDKPGALTGARSVAVRVERARVA
ncbi:MAG: dihydroneopterin aldolase [Kiritimatiellia bacterium]